MIPSNARKRRQTDFLPTVIEGVQCLGSERSVLECVTEAVGSLLSSNVFQALPPGSPLTLNDTAYLSCTSKCSCHPKLA